jgi:hypothetical protein
MKKYEGRISNEWDIPIPVSIQRDPSAQEIKNDNRVITSTSTDAEQDKDKEDEYSWKP